MKTRRVAGGFVLEFLPTRWTHWVRVFAHARGIGLYAWSGDHDHVIGYVKNGVGEWRWVNEWEAYHEDKA